MELSAAHSLYRSQAGYRSAFVYSGAFHDEHTARLIALGEAATEGRPLRRDERNRMSFVMVEAYQNIVRHRAPLSPELERAKGRSMFMLRCADDGQEVLAANPVMVTDALRLQEILARVEGQDAARLKQMFLNGLQANGQSQRGGAGLGLIEMARRSGRDLYHALEPLDEDHQLFSLRVAMGEEGSLPWDGWSAVCALHTTVGAQDILLLHQGERSAATEEALLRIVEKDLDDRTGSASDRTRAYLAMTEFIHRIADRKDDGILLVAREEHGYTLAMGLAMPRSTAMELAERVHHLAGADRSMLSLSYRESLLRHARGEVVAEIGLVDLARHARAPLEHSVVEHEAGLFLAVKARL